MARAFGWATTALSLCFVTTMSCMPESGGPSGQAGGQGGSQSSAGGRGGSAGRGGNGGGGGSVAGSGGTGGSSTTGTGGNTGAGGSGGASTGGASAAGGSGGSGGNGGTTGGAAGGSSSDAGNRDTAGTVPDSTTAAVPKLSTDVLPIVKANCARSGCHDPMKKEHGMDVSTAPGIIMSWVNRQTADHCKNNATVTRVVPLKPENSFVVTLISTQLHCNEVKRMPPPPLPMLSPDQIKTIRDWILAGAKND
jgi:hypothetical protein